MIRRAPAMRAALVASGALLLAARAEANDVAVTNAAQLTAAIAGAKAGDRIVLASGTYALSASPSCNAVGTAAAPIEVVAQTPLGAKITFDTLEGFKVNGPFWRFDGLDVRGVCATDSNCEHAFHVAGTAKSFVLRRSRVVDFNAQIKVNANLVGTKWETPDDGLIEGNELFDTRARNTGNPTTKINIDTGERWIVRANYIHDYQKGGGDGVSYAAFMKSGSKAGVFERNLVVCAKDFTGGTRIGLSFGGGGTGNQFCAPAFDPGVACDPEHDGGTLRNNVIASCNDVGIYLNKAKNTKVLFNTLIATNGVDFRYLSSTGVAAGNVLSSAIRGREQGSFSGSENLESFAGFDAMYMAPLAGDLRKKGDLGPVLGKGTARADVPNDYCSRIRPASGPFDLGALQASLGDCETVPPPLGGPTPPIGDAGSETDGATPGGDAGSSGASSSSSGSSPGNDSGCGCSTRGEAPWSALTGRVAVAIALALALRRRRASRG